MQCKNHSNRIASNKKYELCDECNYIRLHGKSKNEVYAERQARKPIKQYILKRSQKPIGLSEKGKERAKKVSEAKSKVMTIESICKGCGTHGMLTNSHILSVKQRQDLEDVVENIQELCMTCHANWESWQVEKMLTLECFEDNMKFIEKHDLSRFWRYMYKIIDYLKGKRPDYDVVEKIKRMYFYNLIQEHLY